MKGRPSAGAGVAPFVRIILPTPKLAVASRSSGHGGAVANACGDAKFSSDFDGSQFQPYHWSDVEACTAAITVIVRAHQ